MSIQGEIDRLSAAKASIAASLQSMGVTPPEGTTLEQYAAQLAAIASSAPWLPLSGGTMTGHVDFANGKGAAFFPNGSSNVNEAVLLVAYKPENGIACLGIEGKYGLAQARVKSVADPIDDFDAANKAYVDSKVPKTTTVTLTTAGWAPAYDLSGTVYEQTVTVNGIVTDPNAQAVDISAKTKEDSKAMGAAGVWCNEPTVANKLTFTCDTAPDANITLNIKIQEAAS